MNVKNQPQDRQQILIDLYKQYLLSEITLGQLL
ncbi:transcriptional regulator, partial [Acinetobacter baumannii]